MEKKGGKRGQVTLFIIIGLVIFILIIFVFIFMRRGPENFFQPQKKVSFERCVKESLSQDIKNLSRSGGYNKVDSFYYFNGEKIPYFCYTSEYYKTCVVQNPLLINHFKEQLKSRISGKINDCYRNSLSELSSQGYDVSSGNVNFEVFLDPERVKIEIYAPTKIGSKKYTKFVIEENNDIYNILMLATSILEFESKYGDSDISSLMFLYDGFIIDKLKQGDGTKVYIISSKKYKTEFKFASRSLVWPPGYYYG